MVRLKTRDLTFNVHLVLVAFFQEVDEVVEGVYATRKQTTNQNRAILVRFPHNYYFFRRPRPYGR